MKKIALLLTVALIVGLFSGCAGTPVIYYTDCTCPTGSHENNTPAMAHRAVETALSAAGLFPALSVAPRDTLSDAHIVTRRAVCRK